MEGKYIFALIVLGVFFLLMFVSFALLEYGRIKDQKLRAWISEQYNKKDVKKYDYDSADGDELIPARKAETVTDEVDDADEVAVAEAPVEKPIDEAYGKIDVEGIEEITGNYNG